MPKRLIKGIIFDWGRTLHDPERDRLFTGVLGVVRQLADRYAIGIITLAASESAEERKLKIERSPLAPYVKSILVGAGDKDSLYETAVNDLAMTPEALAIVDDQVKRGIRWGRRHGAVTIWFRNGMFANDLPLSDNETPDFTITDFRQLQALFEPQQEVDIHDDEGRPLPPCPMAF